jgi:hypothetical protein
VSGSALICAPGAQIRAELHPGAAVSQPMQPPPGMLKAADITVKGGLTNMLKHVARAAAAGLPAALLAGLGIPALGALVFLTVLVLGVICWIIDDEDRSERVTRMLLARTGDPRRLTTAPASRSRPDRRRPAAHPARDASQTDGRTGSGAA